jgi:hypothetical protein
LYVRRNDDVSCISTASLTRNRGRSRNLDTPIPDIEAVHHALFDTVSNSEGGVISVREVAELAQKYASSSDGEAN